MRLILAAAVLLAVFAVVSIVVAKSRRKGDSHDE